MLPSAFGVGRCDVSVFGPRDGRMQMRGGRGGVGRGKAVCEV